MKAMGVVEPNCSEKTTRLPTDEYCPPSPHSRNQHEVRMVHPGYHIYIKELNDARALFYCIFCGRYFPATSMDSKAQEAPSSLADL